MPKVVIQSLDKSVCARSYAVLSSVGLTDSAEEHFFEGMLKVEKKKKRAE